MEREKQPGGRACLSGVEEGKTTAGSQSRPYSGLPTVLPGTGGVGLVHVGRARQIINRTARTFFSGVWQSAVCSLQDAGKPRAAAIGGPKRRRPVPGPGPVQGSIKSLWVTSLGFERSLRGGGQIGEAQRWGSGALMNAPLDASRPCLLSMCLLSVCLGAYLCLSGCPSSPAYLAASL